MESIAQNACHFIEVTHFSAYDCADAALTKWIRFKSALFVSLKFRSNFAIQKVKESLKMILKVLVE